MLSALKEIGEILLSQGEEFPIEKIKKEDRLVKVIFDLDSGKLEYDCTIECDQERAKEFLWTGNAIGMKPQLVLTTNNPKYLLDPKNKKWAIDQIISEITKKRLNDEDIRKLERILSEVKEKFFSGGKSFQDFEALLSERECPKNNALYTVSIKKDGKLLDLVKEPGYRKFLRYILYEYESEDYPMKLGRCHICGEEKKVLTNPSYPEGTLLIIYNVDKAGFMPELSRKPENMLKAHAVCTDCKKKLVLSMNFIERKLTARIGEELNLFLIPGTFRIVERGMETRMSYDILQNIAQEISDAFNAVNTFEKLEKVEDLMQDENLPLVFLNLLFGYRASSHFSFQYLIQDVPMMELLKLAKLSSSISKELAELFSEYSREWYIGFENISSIFPLKKATQIDWKPLVELFNSMLTRTMYPRENIISRAVLFARINRYKTRGYNINTEKSDEESLCRGLLKYNLLIKLLRELNVIEEWQEAIEMEQENGTNSLKIPDDKIEKFFSMMKYTEWQKALFLLGVLIGKIGIEQYKNNKNKAVLNKIRYEGMPVERVKYLASSVHEGLKNYRLLDTYNEELYAYMKKMLDRNLEALQNPIDNVFYILSGYAYVTLQAITSGGEK
ncbi:MAG: type I-B CRISPR-associated protein Cas8b/Csh1 [Thermoprotei archaeon]